MSLWYTEAHNPPRRKKNPVHIIYIFMVNSSLCKTSLPRLLFLHRVSSRLLGPVDPSFRALSGRRELMVQRHKFNEDCLSPSPCPAPLPPTAGFAHHRLPLAPPPAPPPRCRPAPPLGVHPHLWSLIFTVIFFGFFQVVLFLI